MNLEAIWSSKEKILDATGLSKSEAEGLITVFTVELNKSDKGRPTKLDDKGVFLLMMLYYRHYPTYPLLGLMFEIDTSNAERWVTRAEKAFRTVLSKKNYSHLIVQDHKKKSERLSKIKAKSISMGLNNLFEDLRTKRNSDPTILVKRKNTPQKFLS